MNSTYNLDQDSCSICGDVKVETSRAGDWTIVHCAGCGHRSVRGSEGVVYGDDYVGFREDDDFKDAIARDVRDRFIPRLPEQARLLDVGCGNGEFLLAASRVGFISHGLDTSTAAVALCEQEGLSAEVADFFSLDVDPVDAVTMWDVIEHVPDPLAFLARARDLLNPGGFLVVKTPAVNALSFRLVQLCPPLSGVLLQIPNHIEFFSEKSLTLAGRKLGLEIFELQRTGGMRKKTPGGSVKKRFARNLRQSVDRLAGNANHYVWLRKPAQEPSVVKNTGAADG